MSDFAIRNWAFFAGALIGIGMYLLGRIDQRRRDLVQIRKLRGLIKETNKLMSELKQVSNV